MYKESEYDYKCRILLTAQYGDKRAGEIITVNEGVYDTLIELKKGKPAEYISPETDYTKDQKIKVLEEDLKEKAKQMSEMIIEMNKIQHENEELKKENEELKDYNVYLMQKNENIKTKRTKRIIPNKKIKDDSVETKNTETTDIF